MIGRGAVRARLVADVDPLRIDVELDTADGTLVLVGPNGAGKTSVLELLTGVRRCESGRVEIDGEVVFDGASGVFVPVERRRIGYVPQDYALFPHLSVRGNVEFAITSADEDLDRLSRRRRADHVLRELDLIVQADRRPDGLSGGEKQRLALGRALAANPRALLLDEPLAALDVSSRREMRRFLRATLERAKLPAIVVTHDPADARALGDRIAVLEAGKIVQTGTWADLTERPASPFVEELTGAGE